VLTYARHVQAGRFPYTRVSKNIELPQAAPEPADVLQQRRGWRRRGKALDIYSPQNEHYRKLKAALADLRGKPGASKGQIDTILANMERWRWYPRDLGNAYSLVNLPDFTLRVMHNGGQVWTTRIVIGKPSMPTPLLSETMKYLTVNPTWTVPQSIVRNEYLPALAQDPTVLERMGLRVSYSGGGVTITQPPGDGNALGRVRFSFNNRFSVFQHDTPDKGLFSETVRAYSHGCMRVQDPPKYAEVLLSIARPSEHWTAEKIRRMYGGGERDLPLQATPIWVHLTYQTAFVDNAGKLEMRRDIYGLDGRTIAAIKSERGNLEAGARAQARGDRDRPAQAGGPRPHRRALAVDDLHDPGLCPPDGAAADLPLSAFVLDQLRTPGLCPGVFSFLRETFVPVVSRRVGKGAVPRKSLSNESSLGAVPTRRPTSETDLNAWARRARKRPEPPHDHRSARLCPPYAATFCETRHPAQMVSRRGVVRSKRFRTMTGAANSVFSGNASIATPQRVTSQAFAVSINKVF
jgi:hypothetical protein